MIHYADPANTMVRPPVTWSATDRTRLTVGGEPTFNSREHADALVLGSVGRNVLSESTVPVLLVR